MTVSVNAAAWSLIETMRADADTLRVAVAHGAAGEILLDAGASAMGGIAAGLRLAEICMGGLGTVRIGADTGLTRWPWGVTVRSSQPVVACLASQYAGWSLQGGEGAHAFFALGSGPARALARQEELFAELTYRDNADRAVLVLESAAPPPRDVVLKVAQACGVAPAALAVAYAPTQSLAGGVQVVARVLEVALHKAHALRFPLDRVLDGMGVAPLPPPHPDFVTAMGRTNDAIIFGGRVHLFVAGPADDARELAERLPASVSRDYGRPFADTFRAAGGDFYAIDPMLFSPAEVIVTAMEQGRSFRAGKLDPEPLDTSFGG
jgi:methenyltetrahydromethanopterin cyclohydrolase